MANFDAVSRVHFFKHKPLNLKSGQRSNFIRNLVLDTFVSTPKAGKMCTIKMEHIYSIDAEIKRTLLNM